MALRLDSRRRTDFIVGTTPEIKRILDQVAMAAKSDAPVYVQGESGTGKETIARAIHYTGHRAQQGFVSVNCGAIPSTLLESEIFGYEKGAFGNVLNPRRGLLEESEGGTLFLEEIDELPAALQTKLLQFLDSGTFAPAGSDTPRSASVRLIAATSKNLKKNSREGRFRNELLRRISQISIIIPPLRERRGDIPILAAHFLSLFRKENPGAVAGFSPEAQIKMMDHPWPGNIRELENKVRQAVVLAQGKTISEDDLFFPSHYDPDEVPSFKDAKRDFELHYLSHVLRMSNGNISKAAKMAKKDRKDFYDAMKRNKINPKQFRAKETHT